MDSLYQEHILDHYKHPHNKRVPSEFDLKKEGSNPSCGDELTLYLKFDGDNVKEMTFEGYGCAVSQAATSMLTDKVKGLSKDAITKLAQKDIDELLGVEVGIEREKCALLSLNTLHDALKNNR